MVQTDDRNRIEPIQWPAPVRRVVLRWDGATWSIASETRVDSMTLAAPDLLPAGDASRGFWVETIDRQGRVRHREVMPDPLLGMEQFDGKGRVRRLQHPPHDVQLEILVPDLPEVTEIHLISHPSGPRGPHDTQKGLQRTRVPLGRTPGKPGGGTGSDDHGTDRPTHGDDPGHTRQRGRK